MYRSIRILAALLVVFAAVVPPAVAAEPELLPDAGTFEERLDPRVDVSGQLLAGIMYAGPGDKVHLDGLHVSFAARPGEPDERLCIRLASRDGVYSAKWTTTLDVAVSGLAKLPIATRNELELRRYKADELVALASVGDDCNAADRVYLPTLWGRESAAPKRVTLFLNADTSDAVVAARLAGSEEVRKSRCRILSSTETTTAFDTICALTFEGDDDPVELVVLRQNFSTPLEPLRYPLVESAR